MTERALSLRPGAGAEAADAVLLPYEARWRRRGRLVTEAGRSVLLDLPEAMEFREGDALALEGGGLVAVRAAAEPLAEVRAEGRALARIAWHVGNRHAPAQVEAGRILIQRDHVMEDMLAHLGAEVRHVEEPFTPEGGAYGHGRTHSHHHGHDPDADPDAGLRAAAFENPYGE